MITSARSGGLIPKAFDMTPRGDGTNGGTNRPTTIRSPSPTGVVDRDVGSVAELGKAVGDVAAVVGVVGGAAVQPARVAAISPTAMDDDLARSFIELNS